MEATAVGAYRTFKIQHQRLRTILTTRKLIATYPVFLRFSKVSPFHRDSEAIVFCTIIIL